MPTIEDFTLINDRVVTDETVIPQDIKYATNRNAERYAINAAVFEKHCTQSATVNNGAATSALLVFSDNLVVKTGKKSRRPIANRSFFWQVYGEDNMKVNGKTSERVDPVLGLFHNCEIMLTRNEDVKGAAGAKANGTRATLKKVELKGGEEPFMVKMGDISVPAVFASNVLKSNL